MAYGALASSTPASAGSFVLYANMTVSFAAVFALRGVYFALLEESRVPLAVTGTAVGLVSLIGYTPDIFFGALTGRLLDRAPGVAGHQHYFWLLTSIAIIGGMAALVLLRMNRRAALRAAGDPAAHA